MFFLFYQRGTILMDGHFYQIKPLTDNAHKRGSLNGTHVISRRSFESTLGVKGKTLPITGSYDCTSVRVASFLSEKVHKVSAIYGCISFFKKTCRRQKNQNFIVSKIFHSLPETISTILFLLITDLIVFHFLFIARKAS